VPVNSPETPADVSSATVLLAAVLLDALEPPQAARLSSIAQAITIAMIRFFMVLSSFLCLLVER
jgi:hypothetical protein